MIANSVGDQEEWVDISIEMLETVGISTDRKGFYETGERIYNLTRMFNVREGLTREDDYLPAKMYEGRSDTGWRLRCEDFERLLDMYYDLRGWDRSGVPTPERLKSLGLDI